MTLLNSFCSRQIVSGVQSWVWTAKRDGASRTRKMFYIKWRTAWSSWPHSIVCTFCPQRSLLRRPSQTLHNMSFITDWHCSPCCLIHRQLHLLHQRGHRESHGRKECWPPSLYTSTKTTTKNKDKYPKKSHIKKLSIVQFRSLAISTFCRNTDWHGHWHVFCKHFGPFQTFAWCYLTKTWLI